LKAWSGRADVRTTSASATRIVERGRHAFAVARPRTTARMFVTLGAIAPWTRIAAQADIAHPRGKLATLTPIIATRHRTSASTIRTALRSTRGQPPRLPVQPTHPALTTRRTTTGSALSPFAALHDPLPLAVALPLGVIPLSVVETSAGWGLHVDSRPCPSLDMARCAP